MSTSFTFMHFAQHHFCKFNQPWLKHTSISSAMHISICSFANSFSSPCSVRSTLSRISNTIHIKRRSKRRKSSFCPAVRRAVGLCRPQTTQHRPSFTDARNLVAWKNTSTQRLVHVVGGRPGETPSPYRAL